jgi:hypothetical protein
MLSWVLSPIRLLYRSSPSACLKFRCYLLCPVFAVNGFFDRAPSVSGQSSKRRGRPGRTQSLAAEWIALTPKRGEAVWASAHEENGGRRRQREPLLTAKTDGKRKPDNQFTGRGQGQCRAVTGAKKRKRKCDKPRLDPCLTIILP